MIAILKREFKAYFQSVTGYVFVAFLIFFIGLYYLLINIASGVPTFGVVLPNVIFIFMFAFPILTMRSMAEDRKNKTDQLLMCSPISTTEMVLGKFFSMVLVYAIPCGLSVVCPLILLTKEYHKFGSDLSCILAFFLLGCAYIAIGMYISSQTESQIIAAIITIGIYLMIYLMPSIISFIPTSARASMIILAVLVSVFVIVYGMMSKSYIIPAIIEAVGVAALAIIYKVNSSLLDSLVPNILKALNFENSLYKFCNNSLFDVKGLVFYLSVTVFFIYLTILSVQKRKWK